MLYAKTSRLLTLLLILSLTLAAQAAFASEENNFVVSVKSDLYDEKGYESGCVAIQMALLLQGNGATVTLFASLDGVEISNAERLGYIDAVHQYVNNKQCLTSKGPAPLGALVTKFTSGGGTIIACPLCWNSREFDKADLVEGASIGTPDSMANMFMNAEKIIDF